MGEFKVPAPIEMERFEHYVARVMAELERWVNENCKQQESDAHS